MQLQLESLNLPKVSEAGMRILDVLSKDDYSINDVAVVVAEDPTLSGMMLKYANSPLYRRYQEITSVRNAINLLGVKNVKLVVTLAAMRSFSDVHSIAVEKLWEHSFSIALISKLIAQHLSRQLADEMEFTGIIHDIASMTLAANFPKQCDELLKQSNEAFGLDQLEDEWCETSRGELIDWIAGNLYMPATTIDAIKLLYAVEGVEAGSDAIRQSLVLTLAHEIDFQVHQGDLVAIRQHLPQLEDVPAILGKLGLTQAQYDEVLIEVREKLAERFVL